MATIDPCTAITATTTPRPRATFTPTGGGASGPRVHRGIRIAAVRAAKPSRHEQTHSMCGIVGYVGHRDAVSFLLPALRRLEYRGYDSAGMATLNGHGLEVHKTAGKISSLESLIAPAQPSGCLGIAHTRWATHGRPSDVNAHPHLDCGSRVAVVHNGIIENYRELRRTLAAEG